MKLLNYILFATLLLILSCTGQSVNDRHIGSWIPYKHGLFDTIIFDQNKIITFYIEDKIVIGKEYKYKGEDKTLQAEYNIDYSKKPIWIDIIQTDVTTNQIYSKEECIMEFLSTDSMMFRLPWKKNSLRPTEFDLDSEIPETMIYTRKK